MKKTFLATWCILAVYGCISLFLDLSKSDDTPKKQINSKSSSPEKQPENKKMRIINLQNADENRLMEKVIDACPKIISNTGYGTGFLFGDNGLVITALHVVENDNWVYVQFHTPADDYNEIEETVTVIGDVVGWSIADYDVAFIHIDTIPKGVVPLKPAPTENLAKEQPIWRFGYNAHYKWAQGVFSPLNCPELRCLVTMPAGPGGSGGPFVDGQGRVLGMFQRFSDSDDETITEDNLARALELTPSVAYFLPMPYITTWMLSQNLQ